jgi:hypothetical protein
MLEQLPGASRSTPGLQTEPVTGFIRKPWNDKHENQIAATLIAITGATLAVCAPAHTAVGVTFDFGNVALGYSDGYYDCDHHWHRWAHRGDSYRRRLDHGDNHHGWRHDDRHHRDHD